MSSNIGEEMSSNLTTEEEAESLRYYLAGLIHVMLHEVAIGRFNLPAPTLEVNEEDRGIAYFTTRSGTKYKISIETVEVGELK